MKALVKTKIGDGFVEIRDMPEPKPSKNQVKINVKYAGICGSDLHIYHNDIDIPINPPVIIGHEFSGVIESMGENVQGWTIGERVVSETAYSYCGTCYNCIEGYYNLCDSRKTLGYWYNGVFAPHTIVPFERIHKLPECLSFEEGALLEPLACVVHAVEEHAQIKAGDIALVTGPGPIGLMTMQVARANGAEVIVTGKEADAQRLKTAESLGAMKTVNIDHEDLQSVLEDLTEGKGVDLAFECSGKEGGVSICIKALRKRAQFIQIGVLGTLLERMDFERISFREIRTTGSFGSRKANWIKAIQLAEKGKVKLKPLIGEQFRLDDWEKAFAMYERKDSMKILFDPNL